MVRPIGARLLLGAKSVYSWSMSDDARRHILQRRARFLAAAVATVGIGSVSCKPQPCLSQVQPPHDATPAEDAAPEVEGTSDPHPEPCLSVALPEDDADAGPKPMPQPCLKVMPPTK